MSPPRILSVDLGARHLGWAAQAGNAVQYGLIEMPGIKHPGELYACTRNELERIIVRYEPRFMRFAPAFIAAGRTSTQVGKVLTGQQAVLELVAFDNEIDLEPINERSARKQVLGQCDFGRIDARTGKFIPDSGREEAKALVMLWCRDRGFFPASHDVGDALVLLHYDASRRAAKKALASGFSSA